MQALRGSRGIALPIIDPSARRGWAVIAIPCKFYAQKRDLVPIVQEAGGCKIIAA